MRIERFRDASGNPVDLDCGERISVLTRRESDEIPGSRPQFGDFPGFDSEFSARDVPHEVDDGFGRVITVENGVLRRLIFPVGKQLFERLIMAVVLHENLGQTAPAAELRKRDLFLMGRSSRPKFFQQTDRLEIGLDSSRGSCRHGMQTVILKIPRPDRLRRLLYFRLNRRLHRGELEQIQLYCYHRSILSVDFLPEGCRTETGCSVIRSGSREIKRKLSVEYCEAYLIWSMDIRLFRDGSEYSNRRLIPAFTPFSGRFQRFRIAFL